MKAIRSKSKLLNKMKKYNLLYNGVIYYISDFHSTTVSRAIANKVISENLVIPTRGWGHWFESEWKLNKES